jgi:hypothetical protein
MMVCLVACGLVAWTGSTAAHGTLGTATATADAGLDSCTGTGKALYNCVAGVLDTMGKEIATFPQDEKQTAAALRAAASRLRAAVNKVQALSAISLCQAAIAGALRQARVVSVNNSLFRGWGTPIGLDGVARVLAKAASLIQARG